MNDAQLKLLELYGSNNGVMLDSTHGMNQYGFDLTTLMVNDSSHEGIPVAVLFSTRTAAETFIPFFLEIKNRAPHLCPNVFMSDDAASMYNAWKQVFGEVEYHLLCAWHVKRAWNANFNSKIKSVELRQTVTSDLDNIMKETDTRTFEEMLKQCVSKFMSCAELKEFGEYFISHYMERVQQWAYCYRVRCGINTNMKLERWHRELKYEESGGKVLKRLDKSITLVCNTIRKKLIGRLISLERCKLTTRIAAIRRRHDASKEMTSDCVVEMKPRKLWIVYSSSSSTSSLEMYEVSYEKSCSCHIKCHVCNICIHELACKCLDYLIHYMICKHIHLVCRHFAFGPVTGEENGDETADSLVINENEERFDQEHTAICNEMRKTITSSNIEQDQKSTLSEVESLIPLVAASQSTELLKIAREEIRALKQKFIAASKMQNTLPVLSKTITSQPANKKLEPQKRFVPVKKSSKRKFQLL